MRAVNVPIPWYTFPDCTRQPTWATDVPYVPSTCCSSRSRSQRRAARPAPSATAAATTSPRCSTTTIRTPARETCRPVAARRLVAAVRLLRKSGAQVCGGLHRRSRRVEGQVGGLPCRRATDSAAWSAHRRRHMARRPRVLDADARPQEGPVARPILPPRLSAGVPALPRQRRPREAAEVRHSFPGAVAAGARLHRRAQGRART